MYIGTLVALYGLASLSYSYLMLLDYQCLTLATLIDYLLAIRDPRV
jgi:hypothetical protein